MSVTYSKRKLSLIKTVTKLIPIVCSFAASQTVLAQNYTLDDWKTISTLG